MAQPTFILIMFIGFPSLLARHFSQRRFWNKVQNWTKSNIFTCPRENPVHHMHLMPGIESETSTIQSVWSAVSNSLWEFFVVFKWNYNKITLLRTVVVIAGVMRNSMWHVVSLVWYRYGTTLRWSHHYSSQDPGLTHNTSFMARYMYLIWSSWPDA